jgi:hypothetical protein
LKSGEAEEGATVLAILLAGRKRRLHRDVVADHEVVCLKIKM